MEEYEQIENILKKIGDLERLNRKIIINVINYKEFNNWLKYIHNIN